MAVSSFQFSLLKFSLRLFPHRHTKGFLFICWWCIAERRSFRTERNHVRTEAVLLPSNKHASIPNGTNRQETSDSQVQAYHFQTETYHVLVKHRRRFRAMACHFEQERSILNRMNHVRI